MKYAMLAIIALLTTGCLATSVATKTVGTAAELTYDVATAPF